MINVKDTVVPTREELLSLLSEHSVKVTFDKLNGEQRTMRCTLRASYLPEANRDDKLSQSKIRNLEEKTIVVWDLDANSWRSFRYDRLKSMEKILEQT